MTHDTSNPIEPPAQRLRVPFGLIDSASAVSEKPSADFSREIVQALKCAPNERITCRQITGNFYRCNWWAPQKTDGNPAMAGLVITTHCVRRSEVLYVTKIEQRLVMEITRRRG